MKNFFVSLLSEEGDISMVRFLALFCVVTGAVLAFLGKNEEVALFVGAGMAGKIIQKRIEISGKTQVTEISKENAK